MDRLFSWPDCPRFGNSGRAPVSSMIGKVAQLQAMINIGSILSQRPRRQHFTDWLIRLSAAAFFIAVGTDKFAAKSEWVKVFNQIGWGQWFRYATGIVEALGGLLLLVPRLTSLGAALLACAMIGAIIAHLFLLGDPFASIIPAALLGIVVAITVKLNSEPDEINKLNLE